MSGGTAINKRVIVAMSGGVDSTLAAALLMEAGWNVTGITLRLWMDEGAIPPGRKVPEPALEARAAAESLGIEHHVVEMNRPFRDKVVQYFIEEYRSGRTPNPCTVCNREIKFAALVEKAFELGIPYVATGHYARVEQCPQSGRYLLRKGVDPAKDQSYMLYNLTQNQLSCCLFPLGSLTKNEVRRRARERGLAASEKSESQEICFITEGDYRSFLRRSGLVDFPGPVVDSGGRFIGEHRGLANYTVGQRRGLGFAASHPLHVLEIRFADNTLVVGGRRELGRRGLELEMVNLVALGVLEEEIRANVKIRYRSPEAPAVVAPLQGERAARIIFDQPQYAVAPGQAAVFYRNDIVLGGGTIKSSYTPVTA